MFSSRHDIEGFVNLLLHHRHPKLQFLRNRKQVSFDEWENPRQGTRILHPPHRHGIDIVDVIGPRAQNPKEIVVFYLDACVGSNLVDMPLEQGRLRCGLVSCIGVVPFVGAGARDRTTKSILIDYKHFRFVLVGRWIEWHPTIQLV